MPDEKRELVKHVVEHCSLSINQACKSLTLNKSSYYYEKKIKDDSAVIEALNDLVELHPRNGFWRVN